jgi:class 3 adenylate cyclase
VSPDPQAQPAPVAERKVTSVLFGDLVGFTSLSETRDKEEVRELLSEYFAQCRRIVARYGGTVEKFIGDAVMAVWGVPAAHDDDAERAVRAGLELIRAVEVLGEERSLSGLALRVGIVTGEVAVTLGAEHEGMVAGDAVNTAARVQAVAEPGQVWVDETTRLLTSGAITYVDVGSHALKGKADPMPLWAVRAVVAAIGGAQRADGLEAPLTGRARELRVVKELFHGVEDSGRPALVLVNGDPGLGKSRLGWEFEKYIDGMSVGFAWHSTRCLAYGEGVAFWPIAEAVRGRLGLIESDLDADPMQALDAWLARCVPDEDEAAWLRPRLLVLLGRGASGGYDRDDLFAAWRTFFERARESRPAVVLLIDDAQHADDGTVQFVEHLLANSEAPLFVMLLARPDLLQRWPALATNRRATVLHLATLDTREMAELLDGLVSGLPEEVRDGLVERAQGVPLYAIETIRSLIDRDLVVPRGGVYVLPDPSRVDLASIGAPASLQALVAARLDGLAPDQRRVVTDASVLGMTFTRDAITALSGDLPDLDAALAALTRLEILGTVSSRLSAEYGQYRFVQPVVRQVAYGTQSRRDRKVRHLAVADYFRSLGDPSGDHAPVLAQNVLDAIEASGEGDSDLAELQAQAVGHLSTAAVRARALGAPLEALRYLETALVHAGTDAETAPLHLEAAWAACDCAQPDSALAHGRAALDLFTAAGDPIGAGGAAAAVAQCLTDLRGDSAGALDVANPHWEALQDVTDARPTLLLLGRSMARAKSRLNLDGVDVAVDVIRIAEALGDRPALADAFMSLALAYIGRSPALTRMLTRAGVDIAREEQRPNLVARGLGNLAVLTTDHDLIACQALHDEALDAIHKAGSDVVQLSNNSLNLTIVSILRGELSRAEALLDSTPDFLDAQLIRPVLDAMVADLTGRPRRHHSVPPESRESDDEAIQGYLACGDLLEARRRGDLRTACAKGEEAVDLMLRVTGLTDDTILIWPYAVAAALEAGDEAALARVLAPVDDAPPGLVGLGFKAHRLRFAALTAVAAGDAARVEQNLRGSITAFEQWGSSSYRARAQAELANWLDEQGRSQDAAPLKQAALAFFESIGANGWLAELGWTPAAMATASD